jgi:hypothetical protein
MAKDDWAVTHQIVLTPRAQTWAVMEDNGGLYMRHEWEAPRVEPDWRVGEDGALWFQGEPAAEAIWNGVVELRDVTEIKPAT